MPPGSTLIEPPALDALVASTANAGVRLALLEWVIAAAQKRLDETGARVELEAIRIEYVGAYLGIGARVPSDDESLLPVVVETIERVIAEHGVADFIAFVASTACDWDARARAILHNAEWNA